MTSRSTTHQLATALNDRPDSSIAFIQFGGYILVWDDKSSKAVTPTIRTEDIFGYDNDNKEATND